MRAQAELALKAVRFGYGAGAWELSIPALAFGGEPVCGIVGPNGSGKSTLLKIAAGLLPPGEGTAALNGIPLAHIRRAALARALGFLPQECAVLFDYTVEQVAAMGRHAHGGVLEMTAPKQDDTVSGVVEILGSVDTPSFGSYYYAYSNTGETLNWQTIAAGSEVTKEGSLGFWYTANLVPGDYYLRLVALDNDGKEQSNCIIRVYVEPEG